MGVPALFRWLSAKYPKIVERVVEAPRLDEAGDPITVNLTDPNPNGCEFDNLYLDMNGIIHPCCHPMDKEAPATEEHMMLEIFTYIDRIFAMIRPRRLLFMAIDGVAPRAKMNQQRSRRFRAARERREKAELAAQVQAEAGPLAPVEPEDEDAGEASGGDDFDSNCITPGTKFMALVAASLRYYIAERMSREPAWRAIKVILSDASIPGEGEHKIMDYIRRQRLDPDYDPATRHVIYGLDADLIMLSMATHEPYFRVLREDVFWEEQVKYAPCAHCGEKGHAPDTCPVRRHNDPTFRPRPPGEKPFIFLDVAVLREYLAAELTPAVALPFAWDLERAIDDWIFMCFFVGNDFLPHLPCLEIREGAIDVLIEIYKTNAERMGGFICQDGDVDLRRVQYILNDLARVEERIFQLRRAKDQRRNEGIRKRKFAEIERDASFSSATTTAAADDDSRRSNREAAQALKEQLRRQAEIDTEEPQDEVRLWERGGKARYYQNKFKVQQSDTTAISDIVKAYVEGLCWVMAYYYQGCPSWKWFYPYHFAPLAEDMRGVDGMQPHFELGEPFRPFDQLMGVFPADSRDLVPEPFRRLMTAEESEVIDFYPTDFDIDLNGKKHLWQGVVLLPFIDEERLLRALETVYPEVTAEDLAMNVRGTDQVFFSLWHSATAHLLKGLDDSLHRIPLDPQETGGLAGYVQREEAFPEPGGTLPSPLIETGCPAIEDLQVACFKYYVPYHERPRLRHKAILLPYAKRPEPILSSEDIEAIKSGAASRRVPGRLNIDLGSAASHGRHSMHQEYSRQYDRRDGGRGGESRGYHDRYRGMGDNRRREEFARYPSSRHAPPPRPSESAHDRHSTLANNPHGSLGGGVGEALPVDRSGPGQADHLPPPVPMMQPAMGIFHRGPPPNRYPPSGGAGGHRPEWNGNRLNDLYGRYPPPSK